MKGRVLIVAGSDSGGGAGIQGDLKTVTMLGAYGATAITALTAQNTQGVFGVHEVPRDFIRQQMELVLQDIGADCLKTGMLHSAPVIETVMRAVEELAPDTPLVADPVMVAKGGHALLDPAAVETLKRLVLPRASLLTPNVPEAEALCGLRIAGREEMIGAAEALKGLGARAVLLKGGHLSGPTVADLLFTADGPEFFEAPRIDTVHTHGTGCTTASAVAAGLAQGMPLRDSIARALAYVRRAIERAPGFGKGHGPLDHAHPLDRG
ncbi:MAG: bifunctional hydroxymethylpyrimidine kinase/phosphomethylpyrimidine kinase [Acetobacterales bacterium]